MWSSMKTIATLTIFPQSVLKVSSIFKHDHGFVLGNQRTPRPARARKTKDSSRTTPYERACEIDLNCFCWPSYGITFIFSIENWNAIASLATLFSCTSRHKVLNFKKMRVIRVENPISCKTIFVSFKGMLIRSLIEFCHFTLTAFVKIFK